MLFKPSRRYFLLGTCLTLTGCGTLLYPERRGQPRGGALDWGVVCMDSIGVLLFFVPGLLAFCVDWYNGTLYLPPGSSKTSQPNSAEGVTLRLGRDQMHRAGIEAAIFRETGIRVSLEPGTYHTRQMRDVDEFDTALSQLTTELQLGPNADQVLRCQSPTK
ncbi:MAG: hypothetical protein KDA58_16330 [Planctomycetaceae bacterium]|nr:hypothetical protein [Planctomycetaceae bacterium]